MEALSTIRGMHVRSVAGEEDPSAPIGRGLPGHIGEPGYPGCVVQTVIRALDGDESLAEITQGRLTGSPDVAFCHHDAHASSVSQTAEGMDALVVAADAPLRLLSPSRPRRSRYWLSGPTPENRYRLSCG